MLVDYKAATPLEACQKALSAIILMWNDTPLAQFLNKATLHDYRNGAFVLAVPTQRMADLMNRRAEQAIIRRTLEVYMPDGMSVTVQAVCHEVQP